MTEQMPTPPGLIVWPNLAEPDYRNPKQPMAKEQKRYRSAIIFRGASQQTPQFRAIGEAIMREAAASFGTNASVNFPLKKYPENKRWAGFEPGDWYLTGMNSLDQPTFYVINSAGAREKTDRVDLFFAGAEAAAIVSFVGYQHPESSTRTILCNLHGLLLVNPNKPRIASAGGGVDEHALDQLGKIPAYALPGPGAAPPVADNVSPFPTQEAPARTRRMPG